MGGAAQRTRVDITKEITMDQNMVKAAAKVWRELFGRGKIKQYRRKPSTITITFTSGEYNLVNKIFDELEKGVDNES